MRLCELEKWPFVRVGTALSVHGAWCGLRPPPSPPLDRRAVDPTGCQPPALASTSGVMRGLQSKIEDPVNHRNWNHTPRAPLLPLLLQLCHHCSEICYDTCSLSLGILYKNLNHLNMLLKCMETSQNINKPSAHSRPVG